MKFFVRILGLLHGDLSCYSYTPDAKKTARIRKHTITCSSATPPVVDTTAKNPGLQLIADSMIAPLVIAEPPDGSKRLFIADETGTIWIIGADGKKLATPFIDISGRMVTLSSSYDERGLLGMAFHPDFKTNGKFYLFYTAPPRCGHTGPGTPRIRLGQSDQDIRVQSLCCQMPTRLIRVQKEFFWRTIIPI